MSDAVGFQFGSWFRKYWWLAWSLATSAYAGQVCYEALIDSHSFPTIVLFPATIGVPMYFSRLIAFSYLQLKEWWQVVALPFVAATLGVLLLWPVHRIHIVLPVSIFGFSDILLIEGFKYFLALFVIDIFVAYAGQILDRRVVGTLAAIDLSMIWWLIMLLSTMTSF